jgi:hypothetical protein
VIKIFGKAIAPLFVGFFVAGILIYIAEGEQGALTGQVFDAATWSFGHLALSLEILFFGVMLLSNFVTIFVGASVYLHDISKAKASYGRLMDGEDSGWASIGISITCLALLVLIVWIASFVYQAATPHSSLDVSSPFALRREFESRSMALELLLGRSSTVALIIFFLFGMIDYSILRVMRTIEDKKGSQFIKDNWLSLKKLHVVVGVARGSIWFVDIPGIAAGIFLLAIGFWMEDFHHIANGVTDLGAAIFEPYKWDGRSFANVDGQKKAITLTFTLGFAAGVHILQLFLSQLIFAIIVVRTELGCR